MSGGPLAGKVAIVTGASRGIGRATALALGREGATVVVNYVRSASLAEEVVAQIGADRAVAIKADVSDINANRGLVDEVVQRYGRLDILMLNAAVMAQNGGLDDITEAEYDRLYTTNVKAPLFTIQHANKHMAEGGRIVLYSTSLTSLSSVAPNYLSYVTTKGAVEQMVRILAKDLGRRGITVNAIAPGPTDTDGFKEGKSEEIIKMISGWHPQGRVGAAEEVANVSMMVVRPESQWLNGQIIRVNGGMTVG